jgi:PH (Pleckstrin Homology) domain-containing protein
MTTTSILTLAALALVVLLGPRLIRRIRTPAQKHVPMRGGVLVMRSPRRYAIALGVSALIPAAVLAAMAVRLFAGGRAGAVELATITGAAVVALAVVALQFAAAFRQGFVVDEFGLSRVGVLGRRRLRWGEVAKFAYNPMNQWFFVTAVDGAHLWIPVDTHGIADFATIALVRLPPGSLQADPLAREALEELAASEAA